jgi:iron-sulfur cluster insertion protein
LITIDDSAKSKIKELFLEEQNVNLKGLRIFVQGGGCSGFQYGFTWDDSLNEDDFVFDITDEIKLLVDSMSSQYLQGTVVKYKTDLSGEQFVMENPNVQTTCGCGSSFSV